MRSKLAFLMVLLSLCGWSQAQVYRCEDGRGKTIYSDSPCVKGQNSALIENKKSEAEILRERESAAQANAQRLEKENAQLKRRQLEKDIELKEQRAATAAASSVNPANTPACAKARKDMDWINNIQSLSDADRRARMNAAITQVNAACGTKTELIQEPVQVVAPMAPVFSHCYNGRCFDTQGHLIPGRTQ